MGLRRASVAGGLRLFFGVGVGAERWSRTCRCRRQRRHRAIATGEVSISSIALLYFSLIRSLWLGERNRRYGDARTAIVLMTTL